MTSNCMMSVTSERFLKAYEKSEQDVQNSDDINRTGKRQFLFTEKSFGNISRCMPCHRSELYSLLYKLKMHFGFEKKQQKKTVYFIEQ